MRGTHVFTDANSDGNRITPAHAGNTIHPRSIEIQAQDHPRTCGEHRLLHLNGTGGLGSPPHMRGTHFEKIDVRGRNRITPAHAGNTV